MHKYPQLIHNLPHKTTVYPQVFQKRVYLQNSSNNFCQKFPQANFCRILFCPFFFILGIKKSACTFYASGFNFQTKFYAPFLLLTVKKHKSRHKIPCNFFIKIFIPKKLRPAGQLQESTYIQNSGTVRFLSP